jgi:membrane protein
VSWRHALIGGGAVAIAGIAVKWGFSLYLSSGPLTSIYGAFTAVPVVLLWIYLTWILVLAGAAIAATIPMLMSGRFADTHRTGNDFLTGIALLYTLMMEQEKGRTSVSIRELCNSVDSYPEAAGAILERLSAIGYVGRIKDDRRNEELWGLLVSPQQTTLAAAVDALLIDGGNSLIAKENAPLHDWYALVNDADWQKRPMSEILRFVHPLN